jgi:alpha-tubulin suppressor-like RCC1 family protein
MQRGEVSTEDLEVAGITGALALAVGAYHNCVITRDRHVACWGANMTGQLGDGSREIRSRPVQVRGLTGVSSLSLGYSHTCATTTEGALHCWGQGRNGQLGIGSGDDRLEPAHVASLSQVTSVATGEDFTCAVHGAPGTVSCWGSSSTGVLGGRHDPAPTDPVMSTGALVEVLR